MGLTKTKYSDQPPRTKDVVVLVVDKAYFPRALQTMDSLRKVDKANWQGDILLIHGSGLGHEEFQQLEQADIQVRTKFSRSQRLGGEDPAAPEHAGRRQQRRTAPGAQVVPVSQVLLLQQLLEAVVTG